ncbi:MAG: Nif3-like dinuclear metal center hexameric protein [Candidatus Hodarchaeota archaeon]
MATLWEVVTHLEKLVPSMYVPNGDVNGVILGTSDINKQKRIRLSAAAICVDITVPTIIKSSELGAGLLIAHRSPFPKTTTHFTGLSQLLLQHLLKRNLTVYIAHYAWAVVDQGMTDVLAHTLGFKVNDVFKVSIDGDILPLGRVCAVPKETNLKTFIQYIAKRLRIPSLTYVGKLEDEVDQLLLMTGKGITEDWLRLAKEQGCDTYLTGHITHELAMQASQLKMKLVAVPQISTEIPGMSRLTQILRVEHPKVTFSFLEPSIPYSTILMPP